MRKAFTPAKYGKAVRRRRNFAGFTLMEILLAITVFSFAMVIVAGIFSTILGNQSSISTNSVINKESERIIRQISDDMINAIAVGGVTKPNDSDLNPNYKPKGILFLRNDGLSAEPNLNCQIDDTTNCDYSGVVLFSKTDLKIYRFNSTDKTIEYAVDTSPILKIVNSNKISTDYKFETLNSDKVEILSPGFRGIACYNANCKVAPFIKIGFTTQTKGYATKSARQRAKLEIRTIVAGRSY